MPSFWFFIFVCDEKFHRNIKTLLLIIQFCLCILNSPRSVPWSQEQPDYFKPLSLRLYDVMEDIGGCVEMRKWWRDASTTQEILLTIEHQPNYSCYCFGSAIEGTTTWNMDPDVDVVIVDEKFPVVTQSDNAHGKNCFLLLQDNTTEPGYAKLQLIHNGVPQFYNRLERFSFRQNLITLPDQDNRLIVVYAPALEYGEERHGPARFRVFKSDTTGDFVSAHNCSEWPDCASEWLSRKRYFDWPPAHAVERCKGLGCLLVPVGHPLSYEQYAQWRLSFSHQERLLVELFNSVQLQCYMLLKLIKRDILPYFIKDETLSSYHCKTCMFYMIESTPNDFWRPENLLTCVDACLNLLQVWANNSDCPNYFIPEENMFDRLSEELKDSLNETLQYLIKSEFRFLLHLQSNEIGLRLSSKIKSPLSKQSSALQTPVLKIPFHTTKWVNIQFTKTRVIQKTYSPDPEVIVQNLIQTLYKLRNTKTVTTHNEDETRQAISYIVPYLEVTLIANIVAVLKQQCKRNQIWSCLSSNIWNHLSENSDCSVKLKQASLMFMFGYYRESLDILVSLDQNQRYSACYCYKEEEVSPKNQEFLDEIVAAVDHTMNKLIFKTVVAPCVAFLPTEIEVTPPAIYYEMLKHVTGVSETYVCEYLKHCALVDGKFLLYFLLYLNHKKLKRASQVVADIDNMIRVITTGEIGHRESCLNLLGWVYKNEGYVDRAEECFRKSLELKPVGNAAFLHMRDIDRSTCCCDIL